MKSTKGTPNYDGTDFGEGDLGLPKRLTSITEEGRAWFARGWLHAVNFNHEAAVDCFTCCTTVGPQCAMGWWGIGELGARDERDEVLASSHDTLKTQDCQHPHKPPTQSISLYLPRLYNRVE